MFRRITLPALAMVFGTTTAVAQNPAPQQSQPGLVYAQQRLTNLLEGITLTVQQKGKVDSVMLRYQPDFPAGSPENATDSTLIQRWVIILPRLDNEVRIVLTPDQQRTWDRNVEQLRLRRRGVGDR